MVNTANRIESTGVAGRIHVIKRTRRVRGGRHAVQVAGHDPDTVILGKSVMYSPVTDRFPQGQLQRNTAGS
jgi:Adenylate and Guanylate cyclase catalytic domain